MAAAGWRTPMLAKLVKPDDHYRAGRAGEWQYEQKLDGLRCLAVRNGRSVELWSRNRLSFTARFPGVVEALRRLPADEFTMDGELVVFQEGRSSFAGLQRPDGSSPPVYCAFDLLDLLGQDTTGLALSDRQSLLAQVVAPAGSEALTIVPPLEGADPAELLRRACSQGWEGLVAKRVGSTYHAGRSADWQKLKCSASQELVIGGWTDPAGARTGFGALLVGYYDEGGALRYAGKVGTGFDEQMLRDLHRRFATLARPESPFADAPRTRSAHWLEPVLVAAVAFSEWTRDGRMRHPSFLGLRPDKDPAEVRREHPG